MENKKIKDSWSKVKPDEATHERILNNILDRVHSGDTMEGKVYNMTMKPMMILAPVAACIIVALAITIPMLLNDDGGYQAPDPIVNGLRVFSRNLTQTEFVDIVSSLLHGASVSN